MSKSSIRYLFGLFALALVASNPIISGCGSSSSTPSASCPDISVPGFYAPWAISLTGDGITDSDVIKNKGVLIYFDLNSDNTVTNTEYVPSQDTSPDQAQGTAFTQYTLTGTWAVNGTNITIHVANSEDEADYSGSLSQSAYPGCVNSFELSSIQTFANSQGQDVQGTLDITAYQYPSTFDANNLSATFTLEDYNSFIKSTGQQDPSQVPFINEFTFVATSTSGGTVTAVHDSESFPGTFTLDNPVINYTFNTSQGTENTPEYFSYNPITGELIGVVYGVINDSNQYVTQYLFYQQ